MPSLEQQINRKSFYSVIAIDKLIIEIPIIQRDYAQGRTNVSTNEVRSDFLRELKQYIDSNKENNDLDFVYGNIKDSSEGKVLILLDGQQRMTTLFLLHWYAALIAGEKTFQSFRDIMYDGISSRFTYKTRYSSSDFCNHIVIFRREAKKGEIGESLVEDYNNNLSKKKISDLIKNEKWFNAYWNEDPTILSMLEMLDSIQKDFPSDNYKNLYQRLIGSESKQPAITFQFLDLDKYELTDELYIKMNSRGRPLTRYENLKSKLLGEYDLFARTSFGIDFTKELLNSDNPKLLRDYISNKFDKGWTDLFWDLWQRKPNGFKSPVVDDMFISIISIICINENIIRPYFDENNNSIPINYKIAENETKELKGKGNHIEYKKLIDLFTQYDGLIMKAFVRIMNFITDDSSHKQNIYFINSSYIDEEALFTTLAYDFKNSTATYYDRLQFFCYYKFYLLYENKMEYFKDWIRFTANLINNTRIDSPEDFVKSLSSFYEILNCLKNCNGSISDYLIKTDIKEIPHTGLSTQQIEEEQLKAILSQNNNWKNAIDDAEIKLTYFRGELNYPLCFYSNCSITTANDDLSNQTKLESFVKVVKRLKAIFISDKGCPFDRTLSRTLISIGDYTKPINSANSLLTNLGSNARYISWKTYLGDTTSDNKTRKEYFSKLIDLLSDSDIEACNISDVLEKIAKDGLQNNALKEWQKKLILYPEIYKSFGINYNYLKIDSEQEIYVLGSSGRKNYHSELYTLSKYYELKKNNDFQKEPFLSLDYRQGRGNNAILGFRLKDSKLDNADNKYELLCEYAGDNNFYLSLNNCYIWEKGIHKEITDETILDVLKTLDYEKTSKESYRYKDKISEEDLITHIYTICDALKTLIS